MKSIAISLLLIIAGIGAIALSGCTANSTFDPVTGKLLTKTVVPDKEFTSALATVGVAAAQQAIKAASDDYLATHLPKSAVAPPPDPAVLPPLRP